jgi:hypothetical protein
MAQGQSLKWPDESAELNMHPPYRRADTALGIWACLFPRVLRRVTLQQLLDTARRQAKLSNFGTDDFLGDLRILLEATEEESLSHLGRLMFRRSLVRNLKRRLFLQKELELNPCIVNESIRAPIVIVGFFRSGTTLLQNLLGLAPGARLLWPWESLTPFPRAEVWGSSRDRRRLRFDRRCRRGRRRNIPIDKLHPLDSPAECWNLLTPSFHCHSDFIAIGFDNYQRWYQRRDRQAPRRAYALHRLQLQFVQNRTAVGHWVLKSPEHMIQLQSLLETYPDARVIHLHREPRAAVASLCNLCAVIQPNYVRELSKRKLGEQVTDYLAIWARRAVSIRDNLSEAKICDVAYSELITNPIETLERIYEHFGMAMTPEFYNRILPWRDSQRLSPHRGSTHHFDQFALSQSVIDRAFDTYRDYFQAYLTDP